MKNSPEVVGAGKRYARSLAGVTNHGKRGSAKERKAVGDGKMACKEGTLRCCTPTPRSEDPEGR